MQTHLVQSHYVQRTPSDSITSDAQRAPKPTARSRPATGTKARVMCEVKFARSSTATEKDASSEWSPKILEKAPVQPAPSSEILWWSGVSFLIQDGVRPHSRRVKNRAHHLSWKWPTCKRPCSEASVFPKKDTLQGTARTLSCHLLEPAIWIFCLLL